MTYHIPVLTREVIEYLNLKPHGVYVDATFGGGGHTRALLEHEPTCRVVAMDWDMIALEKNGEPLQEEFPDRLDLVWGNFAHINRKLKERGIGQVDGVLADFGTSQYQIKQRAGFSFNQNSPLDMRMSPAHQKTTAAEIVNKSTEQKLRSIFKTFGQEPNTNKIVRAIIEQRSKKWIKTTRELAQLVERVSGPRKRIHPATRVFQALRMYVNDELNNITAFLKGSVSLLKKDGRLVCISFHSLEDRLVKQIFKEYSSGPNPLFTILTPTVVMADEQEVQQNPSSRSAKLRAAQFIGDDSFDK